MILVQPFATSPLRAFAPPLRRRRFTPRKRLRVVDQQIGRLVWPWPTEHKRPTKRPECGNVQRPCPFVSCKYHLAIEVSPAGGIIEMWPGREIWDLDPEQSCTFDVIRQHPEGLSLQQIADMYGISRERVRQILEGAVAKVRAAAPALELEIDERNPGAGENCEGAAIDWGDE